MYKLKRIVFCILLLSFIIKANECYGMEINENNMDVKTVKTLPYPKIFMCGSKFFFSLAHSIINNFYELEKLEMNKVYSLKKYLCWGYRLQPTSLAPFSFLDFNVNILGGIIDTAIFLYLYPSLKIKTPSKIFYSLTSFLNINLNIRIKSDFYIAINILGLMRAIFIPFLIKDDESLSNIIKDDNNLDINLLGNNKPTNINENDIVNNKNENGNNLNINPFDNKKPTNITENDIVNNKNKNNNNLENKFGNLSEERDEQIQKMYNDLEDEYGVSGFMDEEEFKKMIVDNNFNRNKLVNFIEMKLLNGY